MESQSAPHKGAAKLQGYAHLEATITKVIGQIGLKKTNALLESFIGNSSLVKEEKQRIKLLTTYLISQSIIIFDLDEALFYSAKMREYREARMACYHLLKTYTDQSYPKIAVDFGKNKRKVLYGCQRCKEMLSVPWFYKQFKLNYDLLEGCLIEFISKLNPHTP